MITRDPQVRKLMEETTKHGKIGLAAARAGMDRKTARKLLSDNYIAPPATTTSPHLTRGS